MTHLLLEKEEKILRKWKLSTVLPRPNKSQLTFKKSLQPDFQINVFFLSFYGHTCGIWMFLGQGSNRSCSCGLCPQPQQHWVWAISVNYTAACSNAESLTHWMRPGIEPASSWRQHWVFNPLSHSRNSSKYTFKSTYMWEDEEDGRVIRCEAHLLLQIHWECIYMWNYLHIKTDKRPQDYDRARKISWNQIGRQQEEKEKRSKIGPTPLGGSWKEEKLLHPGNFPPTSEEISQDREGTLDNQCEAVKMKKQTNKKNPPYTVSATATCMQVPAGVGN